MKGRFYLRDAAALPHYRDEQTSAADGTHWIPRIPRPILILGDEADDVVLPFEPHMLLSAAPSEGFARMCWCPTIVRRAGKPRTAELTICACDERTARQAATEFVETAFANALRFWDDDELITDDNGRPLGTVQIEMPNEGEIEPAADAIELIGREEAQQ
jgi:hypothetical protein